MKKLKLIVLLSIFVLPHLNAQDKFPFQKMDFPKGYPYVEFENEMVPLLEIEGQSITEYLQLVKDHDPQGWQKDFIYKLPYMFKQLKDTSLDSLSVSIKVKDKIVATKYALSTANFASSLAHYNSLLGQNRIQRTHETTTDKGFDYLTLRRFGYEATKDNWLTRKEVIADLEHLEWRIEEQYSYKDLRGFNYRVAFDAIINDLKEGIHKKDLGLQLKMLMGNFGDGHSDLSFYKNVVAAVEKNGKLPFRIIKHQNEFYAFNPNAAEVDIESVDDLSKIESIEGIPMSLLYEMASKLVAKGTPRYVENKAMLYLSEMKLMLSCFGIKKNKVQVILSKNGKFNSENIALDHYSFPSSLSRDTLKVELLENNIGKISLRKVMFDEDELIESLEAGMEQLKHTDGLIIDIRRNSGGDRLPLLTLLPYFIQEPVVCNAARYRIDDEKDFKPEFGYLEDRNLFVENYKDYSDSENLAIANFKKDFAPTYLVKDEVFTDFCYLVISPDAKKEFYDKPVILLMDSYCFSASDIFAAAMTQAKNIKLMGETTGGGSGFAQDFLLPHSKMKLKLSTIVSYQPNGKLYDGNGVEADIEMEYTLLDKMGKSDSMLEKAIQYLLENR